jgi:galactokinase
MKQEVVSKFIELYDSEPVVFRSPGRINIIGEHIDYNDGFVLPTAINKEICFAVSPNDLGTLRAFAYNLNEDFEISLKKVEPQKDKFWTNYLLGVIDQLQKHSKQIQGVDVVFRGNIPRGAGISSSAAIECGFVYALNDIFKLELLTLEMAQYAQAAEHEYAGVKCGIMDQYAVLFSKKKALIKLDCRSLTHEYVPYDLDDYLIILCDTGVTHSLASSEYNKRREECSKGLEIISLKFPYVKSFRDVKKEYIQVCEERMEGNIYNRCLYVIEENARVEKMCSALTESRLKEIGGLLYASHEGLKNRYGVSCRELDELVSISKQCKHVLGARMTGGGFGGCTLNLVYKQGKEEFVSLVKKEYYTKRNKLESIIIAELAEGVSKIHQELTIKKEE